MAAFHAMESWMGNGELYHIFKILFKILFHCVNHHRREWFRFPLPTDTEEFLEANLAYTPPVPERLTVLLMDVESSIPIGTVMSRLSRGRKLLRGQLAGIARFYGIGQTASEGLGV